MRYLILILMLFLATYVQADSTLPAHETIGTITVGDDSGTTPTVVFDCRTDAGAIGTRPCFYWDIYDTNYMAMDASGNFGIGDSTPDAKLDVEGSAIITGTLTINGETLTLSGCAVDQVLVSDGAGAMACAAQAGAGGGNPSGPVTGVQYNTGSTLDAEAAFTYTAATNVLNLNVGATTEEGGISVAGNLTDGQGSQFLEDTTHGLAGIDITMDQWDLTDEAGLGNALNEVHLEDLVAEGINYIIDGGGSAISTGIVKGDVIIPWDIKLTSWTISCDISTTITVDVWVNTYANLAGAAGAPTDADSITTGNVVISAALKNQDLDIADWTEDVVKGTIMRFNVDANDNATYCTVSLNGYLIQ